MFLENILWVNNYTKGYLARFLCRPIPSKHQPLGHW